jgi:hypothetical protein
MKYFSASLLAWLVVLCIVVTWSPSVESRINIAPSKGANGLGSSSKRGEDPIGKGDAEEFRKRAAASFTCGYNMCGGNSKGTCNEPCCVWSRQHKECEAA